MRIFPPAPVAVGGVGGSGTRVIAAVLLRLGYDLGPCRNASSDNLWFTFLFKRRELLLGLGHELLFERSVRIFSCAMRGGEPLGAQDVAWLTSISSKLSRKSVDLGVQNTDGERASAIGYVVGTLIASTTGRALRNPGQPLWGWKEPNTHLALDKLLRYFPEMKYIHVVRHGLDMAYSANQNQLILWGQHVLPPSEWAITPRASLKYWCFAQRRVLEIAHKMRDHFLLINFDVLCEEPRQGVRNIAHFLGQKPSEALLSRLSELIQPPASRGRFKVHGTSEFDPADIRYVESLGFHVR